MVSISIEDTEVQETDKKAFQLLYSFENYLNLAIAYIERTGNFGGMFGPVAQVLQNANFELSGTYYHDFGEDHPHVIIKVFLDDDIYLDQLDEKSPTSSWIEQLLDKIAPSYTSKSVQLHPSSLSNGATNNWRSTPQYKLGENSKAVDQESVQKIWGSSSSLHVFISHKDSIKERANGLKSLLAQYGISAFVAHEDIEPAEEWQDVIEKALFSSDALIALLTKDFSTSSWTDQEVGVAFGRQLPVYPVKMEKAADPYGFIGKIQGFGLKDGIVEKLVEKFLDDERTLKPTISSVLNVLNNSATNRQKLLEFLETVEPKLWSTDQKDQFWEAYEGDTKIRKSKVAQNIADRIKPEKEEKEVATISLDDEIPF